MRRGIWLAMALVLSVAGAPALAAPQQVDWQCEVVYQPERSVWARTVRLSYDERRLLAVAIDGVAVHTFTVYDTWVLTSQDNERIQIDANTRTWTSDFRGLAQGQGRCEPAAP